MNVLLLINSIACGGGAERLVFDIYNELKKRSNIKIKMFAFESFCVHDDVPNGDFFEKQLCFDENFEVVEASVKLSLFSRNQISVEQLQKKIEEFAPDVIHSHLFRAELISRSVFYPQAKWFSHCHDNMKQFKSFSFKTILNKELFTNYFEKKYLLQRYKANGGNTFIAISKDTEAYFKRNVGAFETVLIPNAIDYRRFYNERALSSKLRLINVGSYQRKKNQIFLVEVAYELRKRNIDFELSLLGDGELYKEVKQKIVNLHLQNCIMQYGNVNNVEEYLWHSDMYVHSATYEPLGLVLLEAMAAGLPVVALDGKGNRDLVEEGKNGYMVYEQNPELFADKILEIWNDKQKYQEMSLFAQEYAKQYDIVPYVDRLLEIYSEK